VGAHPLAQALPTRAGSRLPAGRYARAVIHLRIVAPQDRTDDAVRILEGEPAVINVIVLPDAARKPSGDVIFADVAREDASVVLSDLRRLGLHHHGSIAIETVDSSRSDMATDAEKAAVGAPTDAVVWEELTQQTSESAQLSMSYLAFIVIATLIAGWASSSTARSSSWGRWS
jgi:hypothetical protein